MNALLAGRLAPLLALWLFMAAAYGEEGCLRCHGMATLSLRDPATGILTNFHVDGEKFKKALHGTLACDKCHQTGYDEYPHESEDNPKADTCLACHKTPGKWNNSRLTGINDQYGKSVHFKAFSSLGGCFTCHDIHAPDVSMQDSAIADKVTPANQRCRDCHEQTMGPQSDSSLLATHRWLPETRRHLAEVRCVDCHSQELGGVIHAIGPARLAEQRCESCHRKDSLLLAKLYRYQVLQGRQQVGFINSLFLNEAYVIGMTRQPWLDWASLGLLVMVVLGLSGHGLVRWIMWRRRDPHDRHH